MADEEAKVLKEAKSLPLADRVEHKVWKVRSEAFEDICSACDKAFDGSDPVLDGAGEPNFEPDCCTRSTPRG
jgi:hypothetical protein